MEKFKELTAKMRHHQIRYFKYKTSIDLDKARYYERQVDRILKDELKEVPKSEQQELFK